MKKYLFGLLLVLRISVQAEDCSIPNAKIDDVGEYMYVISESLRIADAQFKLFEKTKKPDATEGMIALKEMKNGFQCSNDLIMSYSKSKNEDIKKSSKLLSNGYTGWVELLDFLIVEYKKDLNLESVGGKGDFADAFSDKMIETRKRWQDINDGVRIASISTIIEDISGKKKGRLSLTKEEWKRVHANLKSNFKFPLKKDKSSAAGDVAQSFFDFLDDKWEFKK